MGIALLAWGRFFGPHGERVTVPAPVDGGGAPWLLDFLARHARTLRDVGFTALELPPTSKAQGGAGRGYDGYGVFNPRDIGSEVSYQHCRPPRVTIADALDGSAFSIDITYLAPQDI